MALRLRSLKGKRAASQNETSGKFRRKLILIAAKRSVMQKVLTALSPPSDIFSDSMHMLARARNRAWTAADAARWHEAWTKGSRKE